MLAGDWQTHCHCFLVYSATSPLAQALPAVQLHVSTYSPAALLVAKGNSCTQYGPAKCRLIPMLAHKLCMSAHTRACVALDRQASLMEKTWLATHPCDVKQDIDHAAGACAEMPECSGASQAHLNDAPEPRAAPEKLSQEGALASADVPLETQSHLLAALLMGT